MCVSNGYVCVCVLHIYNNRYLNSRDSIQSLENGLKRAQHLTKESKHMNS